MKTVTFEEWKENVKARMERKGKMPNQKKYEVINPDSFYVGLIGTKTAVTQQFISLNLDGKVIVFKHDEVEEC